MTILRLNCFITEKKRLEMLSKKAAVLVENIRITKTAFMNESDVTDDSIEECPEGDQLPHPPTGRTIRDRSEAEKLLIQYRRDLLVYRKWLKALKQQFKREKRRDEAQLMKSLKLHTKRMNGAIMDVLRNDTTAHLKRRENPTDIPAEIDDNQTMCFLEKFYLYQVSCKQKIDYIVENIDFQDP